MVSWSSGQQPQLSPIAMLGTVDGALIHLHSFTSFFFVVVAVAAAHPSRRRVDLFAINSLHQSQIAKGGSISTRVLYM